MNSRKQMIAVAVAVALGAMAGSSAAAADISVLYASTVDDTGIESSAVKRNAETKVSKTTRSSDFSTEKTYDTPSASGNDFEVIGGSWAMIYGGMSDSAAVENNRVVIDGTTSTAEICYVYGGNNRGGSGGSDAVTGNTVVLTGTIGLNTEIGTSDIWDIIGGSAYSDNGSPPSSNVIVSDNVVQLTNAAISCNVQAIVGGKNSGDGSKLLRNKLIIENSQIAGGYLYSAYSPSPIYEVSDNSIEVKGSTIGSDGSVLIRFGAHSGTLTQNNSVIIEDSEVKGTTEVYGVYDTQDGASTISGTSVTIKNTTGSIQKLTAVDAAIGTWSPVGGAFKMTGNTVTFDGGTVQNASVVNIPFASLQSGSTIDVSDNVFIWKSGNITDKLSIGDWNVLSSWNPIDRSTPGVSQCQNNALVVYGSHEARTGSENPVNAVKDFNNYVFVIDDTVKNGDTILKATESNITGGANVTIAMEQGKELALNNGDTVTLMTVGGEAVEIGEGDVQYASLEKTIPTAKQNATANDQLKNLVATAEGSVNEYTLTPLANGQVLVSVEPTVVVTGVRQIYNANYVNFRAQTNDVSRRMGELRTSNKDGAWARVYGGQYETGKGMKEKAVTVQIGVDKWFNPNSYVGVTGAYTKADDTFDNGSNDQKNWNVGFYGGYVAESGAYMDAIVKYGQIRNDFSLRYKDTTRAPATGKYHTYGTSVSLEGGWRFNFPNTGFYVEPQVELTYGHIDGAHYEAGDVSFENKAADMLVSRFGVATGYKFAEGKGNVYVKASVLHDAKGEVETVARIGDVTDKDKNAKRDLGGTWGEFVLGGTVKAWENMSLYGEVHCTTKAADVKTKWEGSVGARWTF